MTTLAAPICLGCVHFRRSSMGTPTLRCSAYPDGIPDAIIESVADHREAYRGDRGVRFVANDDESAAYAKLLFAKR